MKEVSGNRFLAMGRKKGARASRRSRDAGGAAAGQSQSGKKRGPFTLRNSAIAGLAVVCGLFFLRLGRPNTNQRSPRAGEAPDHAELGSRRLHVHAST